MKILGWIGIIALSVVLQILALDVLKVQEDLPFWRVIAGQLIIASATGLAWIAGGRLAIINNQGM